MKRIEKFKELLIELNVDGLLIKSKANKNYIGALSGSGVFVLITKGDIYQLMDGRYIADANENTTGFKNMLIKTSVQSTIKDLLEGNKIALENNTSVVEYNRYISEGFEISILNDELSIIRSIKDNEEIELIFKACSISDEIFSEILTDIHIGMTEKELSALITYKALLKGADSMAFDTIIVSGIRGAYPHGHPTDKKFKLGEMITIDFGIKYKGYESDMTRTISLGEPNNKLKEIYEVVRQAQCEGIKFIKEGITGKEVDEYVRGIITSKGYGDYFTHGLGHGMGQGENELPMLNEKGNQILKNGMIMSCEPGIYIEGLGGIRIEDDVLIKDGVGISLNKTSKDLIILEA